MRRVLTVQEMQAVDRASIEAGIPGIILMENAAARVVEYLAERFSPLSAHDILVVCGKGNNGGDGLAIARQLHTRFRPRQLRVVLTAPADELRGDAASNLKMLRASGLQEFRDFGPEMRTATLVIDAVLGTGLRGPASGSALDAIMEINSVFPSAKVIAVDIPSGLSGDSGVPPGPCVRADTTVTFTAPKLCHAMPPACDLMGDLRIAPIGSPASLFETGETGQLALIDPKSIAHFFAPRPKDSNKGKFGHVLVVAGSRGKSGAAAMAGLSALRAGAGLVTVACPESVLPAVAAHTPELMSEPLPETKQGGIDEAAFERIGELADKRTIIALGPGIGAEEPTRNLVRRLFAGIAKPMIVDADALNCLADSPWKAPGHLRVLTPHPGEMSRLTGRDIRSVQSDRIAAARSLAVERGAVIVLKGERTAIALPDSTVWINPTGSPSMATGGTGDILTGMIAGLLGQFPQGHNEAIAAAVYLHGLAGEIAASRFTEQAVIATDLLGCLPEGIREIRNVPHEN